MVSKACERARSAREVNIEMLPPRMVWRLAPMVPNIDRLRTTTPLTTPSDCTTR
jgi:hypothetical protein